MGGQRRRSLQRRWSGDSFHDTTAWSRYRVARKRPITKVRSGSDSGSCLGVRRDLESRQVKTEARVVCGLMGTIEKRVVANCRDRCVRL
jgi:hypothetical protein